MVFAVRTKEGRDALGEIDLAEKFGQLGVGGILPTTLHHHAVATLRWWGIWIFALPHRAPNRRNLNSNKQQANERNSLSSARVETQTTIPRTRWSLVVLQYLIKLIK